MAIPENVPRFLGHGITSAARRVAKVSKVENNLMLILTLSAYYHPVCPGLLVLESDRHGISILWNEFLLCIF